MTDTYTEVTEEGFLTQISKSIKSVGLGLLLFVVAFPVLFINEGCYVKRKQALDEGRGTVMSVSPDSVDSANEGKLVHMTGTATTDDILTDEVFGVSEQAIRLSRTVKMYQWREEKKTKTRKKAGGKKVKKTTYSYTKGWEENLIRSSSFKKPEGHQNPNAMPYESDSWTAEEVTLGAFKLSAPLVRAIDKWESVPVTRELMNELSGELQETTKISAGNFYIGKNPDQPAIGDLRVGFRAVKPTTVSLYAKQVNDTFEQYSTDAGGSLQRLQVGTHSADAMFAAAQKENVLRLWGLRIGGFLMMVLGISLVFSPLVAIANVLPFLGDVVELGGYVFGAVIGFGLSLITISTAWLFYRPIIGVPLFLIGVGAVVGYVVLAKKKKQQAGESLPETGRVGEQSPQEKEQPGGPPENHCPGCGAPTSADDTFCGQCGKDLRAE